MITCRHSRRLMERAFEDRLSVDQSFLLEEHVQGCERCTEEYEAQGMLLDALLRMNEPATPNLDVQLAAIHAKFEEDVPEESRPKWPLVIAAAAAAVIAWFALDGGDPSEPVEDNIVDVDMPDPVTPTETEEVAVAPVPVDTVIDTVQVHPELGGTSEVDTDRYAAVSEEVREVLLRTAEDHLAQDPAAFAEAFDEATRSYRNEDWPLGHMVSGWMEDPNTALAEAACRYTGQRPSRLGASRLEQALDSPARRAATLGLIDAGARGLEGLERALWLEPDLSERALAVLEEYSRPLAWCRRALEHAPHEHGTAHRAWIGLVAAHGEEGAYELVGLLDDPRMPRSELIEAIGTAPEGETALLQTLREGEVTDGLFAAFETLVVEDAYGRLRELAWNGPEHGRAAEVLAVYPGTAPLEALAWLDEGRRLGTDELANAWRIALDVDAERATDLVDRTLSGHVSARTLLDGLALSERPAAVPALIALAARASLPSEERERAWLVASELATPDHQALFEDAFDHFGSRERHRAAACLVALYRLGGADAVRRALPDLTERTSVRLFDRLDDPRASSRMLLARELEPVLSAREALTWSDPR